MQSKSRRRAESGFTMVEIAIAMAVIAFALVALVGLLPLGMETQRDNRQETIVNHDGTYLLEALRGGAADIRELPRFVDSVKVNGVNQTFNSGADVIRALSTVNSTNTAIMRSMTGAASFRSTAVKDLAMRYQVIAQVFPTGTLKSVEASTTYGDQMSESLYEVRLAFYWPVTPAGTLADNPRRQVFRTLVSGRVENGFLNTAAFVKK